MASKKLNQPNILFILTDDQGAWALGCAGNHEIITPNIDRLAESGIRFENFFCTSPVCSPARASILTGLIPSQHGVQDFVLKGHCGEHRIDFLQGQTLYTDVLTENGYVCGISGKWHLGASDLQHPSFSHWYVHLKGGGPYYNAPMFRDGELVHESEYITDAITDDALAFLERQSDNDKPFYLSVHYTAPHDPWTNGNHPQHLLDLYRDCEFLTCPQGEHHPDAVYRYGNQDIQECLKGYYAAVTGMDVNVGRLIKKLDDMSLREHTLIVFMSDNGFNCGHHGIWGKGNGTFSLNMFDTSVKVPAIMSHPGKLPQNKVCDDLLSQYDVMPTLLEYVGLEMPHSSNVPCKLFPGQSFLPNLLGESIQNQENIVVYDEYGHVRMVRSKKWKYIHRYPCGPHEFYDLVNDPDEMVNLYEEMKNSEIVCSMRLELEEWFLTYADPRMDGSRLPVEGNGQIDLAGTYSKGKIAFRGDRKIQTSSVPLHLTDFEL